MGFYKTSQDLFLRGDGGETYCKGKRNDSTIKVLFLRCDKGKTHCK